MEMGQDNSGSGIWETGRVWMSSKGWVEGVGRGNGLRSGSRCSLTLPRGRGWGPGDGWGRELFASQDRLGGGDMRMRGRGVVVPCVRRPWKRPPHSSFAFALIAPAPIRAARLPFAGHDVNIVPRCVGLSRDALARASVLVVPSPSLYSPFSERPCAMGFAAWGIRVDERGEGDGRGVAHCARAPAVYGDYQCGCIVHRRDRRETPRRRARWPAQCGAVDGETYIHRDGRECGRAGWIRCCCCASSCGVHGAAAG
jgi:hypothetical protein